MSEQLPSGGSGGSQSAAIRDDLQARIDALDVARSFLVQAPAGSGKTELLTRRVLALLSVVDEPEEILAITFTVGATAEMRNRVMGALHKAKPFLDSANQPAEHVHAIAALERSRQRGWSLLEQPGRLNIQTIDALCLSIAYSAPLLSRLGGQLQPTEDAQPLYGLAARRTLEQLGGSTPQLSDALTNLLRLRDVSLGDCEALIADMLQAREQWLEEISTARSLSEEDWTTLKKQLESPFQREHDFTLGRLRGFLQQHESQINRLLVLIENACTEIPVPDNIAALHGKKTLDELMHLEHYECLRSVLLTTQDDWRKQAAGAPGFKAMKHGGMKEHHNEFKSVMASISQSNGLLEALIEIASLPKASYTDGEWETIRSIFTVLLHAVSQLRVVFSEQGKMDFVEAGLTAGWALADDEMRHQLSRRTRHLLVDEFQDTSRKQYDLLKNIVRDWDPAERRTCFFVGDPMQSIYLFRNAELALFDEVQHHGFGPDVPQLHFHRLTLSQNFRSIEAIVDPVNAMFEELRRNDRAGARRFKPAVASSKPAVRDAFLLHANFFHQKEKDTIAGALVDKARPVIEIVRQFLPKLAEAKLNDEIYRIGILVRARPHVEHIAEALRTEGIPFRAVEIETLNDRQEVKDLTALIRALTQPMDRVAWLAILRAPWCGLSLNDLHIVSGSDDPSLQKRPIRELLSERLDLLSEDGKVRARRLRSVIERSIETRFAGAFTSSPNGFAVWIEQTWMALGGANCVDAVARENVEAFFKLLSALLPTEASGSTLDTRLEKLFAAADPSTQERCSIQLMTIHKAKGLGFDVVLLPELHRVPNKDTSPLFRRMNRVRRDTAERELLIAPIGVKGQPSSSTYRWIGKELKQAQLEELYRLLYVACTRARTDLHLFADFKVRVTKTGMEEVVAPRKNTLLGCGWDYLKLDAAQQFSDWQQSRSIEQQESADEVMTEATTGTGGLLFDIAAGAQPYLQTRKRLPSNWTTPGQQGFVETANAGRGSVSLERTGPGSLVARARGIVLHALLERLVSLPEQEDRWNIDQHDLQWKTIAGALLRNAGLTRREAEAEIKPVLTMLKAAASDSQGRWILSRQAYEQNEVGWTMQEGGTQKMIRCDRIFLAGAEPLREGRDHLWIVDYKSADDDNTDSFLLDEQERYAPQLKRYAEALRASAESELQRLPIMLALYYPALQRLQWWPA